MNPQPDSTRAEDLLRQQSPLEALRAPPFVRDAGGGYRLRPTSSYSTLKELLEAEAEMAVAFGDGADCGCTVTAAEAEAIARRGNVARRLAALLDDRCVLTSGQRGTVLRLLDDLCFRSPEREPPTFHLVSIATYAHTCELLARGAAPERSTRGTD